MAASTLMSVMPDLQPAIAAGGDYLERVSHFVSKHRSKRLPLDEPTGAEMIIAMLEDTMYRAKPDKVNGWGKFYLNEIVDMLVVGVVKGTSCPCDELVLMTCEDRKIYAYDGEELHVVASDLQELLNQRRIEYPASESYYNGQAFEDMTEDDWKKVKAGPVGKRLDKEHKEMVQEKKHAFLQSLKKSALS